MYSVCELTFPLPFSPTLPSSSFPSLSPLQYKDQVPKQPLSAYMLFTKSKGPKLKAKHPELSQTEMAVKLGEKMRDCDQAIFNIPPTPTNHTPLSSIHTHTPSSEGKKWKSMGSERQEKYKQQYMTLRKSYETQLEQFYSDHPDAKPPRLSRARLIPY